jgi:hypothetical protein
MPGALYFDVVDAQIREECEAWKVAYETAERLHQFEQRLARVLMLLHFPFTFNEKWREAVFTGRVEYSADEDKSAKKMFETIVECDSVLGEHLSYWERQQYEGGVAGAAEYRAFVEKAKETLCAWKAPEASTSFGIRHLELDQEQTKQLRAIFATAKR